RHTGDWECEVSRDRQRAYTQQVALGDARASDSSRLGCRQSVDHHQQHDGGDSGSYGKHQAVASGEPVARFSRHQCYSRNWKLTRQAIEARISDHPPPSTEHRSPITYATMAQATVKNQRTIITNENVIIANQKKILRNQDQLTVQIRNQEKILRNQEAIVKNQKKIISNQGRIL